MGNEIIGMSKRFVQGITVSAETLAREVIDAVGPGGHFLTQKHTLDNFRKELWMTKLFNRQPIKAWQEAGQPTMEKQVQHRVREIIETHKPEPLDSKVLDALERLKREGEKDVLKKSARDSTRLSARTRQRLQ